jgi:hypothetical protein
LRLTFFAELVAQLIEVDLAQVERQTFGLVIAHRLRADRFIDDAVQFLKQLRHISRIAPLGQFLVDSFNIVVPLGVGLGARLNEQRLEPDKDLPRHDFEAPLGLVARIDRIHSIGEALDPGKSLRAKQRCRIEPKAAEWHV